VTQVLSTREWQSAHLHLRIDTRSALVDAFLSLVVGPFIAEGLRAKRIGPWFFVRYSEGGPHIRLRFRASSHCLEQHLRPLVEGMAATAAASGLEAIVSHVVWQPYERELERYGGTHAIRIAERFFCDSSRLALAVLQRSAGSARPYRLGQALVAMTCVTFVFLRSGSEVGSFAHHYSSNYLRTIVPSQAAAAEVRAHLNSARARQSASLVDILPKLLALLHGEASLGGPFDDYVHACRLTAARLETLARMDNFRCGVRAGEWQEVVSWVLPSLVHMTSNRLGISILEEVYLATLLHGALDPHVFQP
jgi:thiopeptide-type bacteriocin biosynthesis protein